MLISEYYSDDKRKRCELHLRELDGKFFIKLYKNGQLFFVTDIAAKNHNEAADQCEDFVSELKKA